MPTWDDVRAHLLERFAIAVEADRWLALSWEFPGPDGDVTQPERIERAEIDGRELAVLLSPVASADRIEIEEALAHNMTLATGALALAGSTVVLRAVLELDSLPLDRLDRAVEVVAHEAARLREVALGGRFPRPTDAFDHWS